MRHSQGSRLLSGALAGLTAAALLTACDTSTAARERGGAGRAAPVASPTRDDACTRLVSAIGFAELRLVPRGHEDEQVFENAIRGYIAYVEGTIVLNGDELPPGVRADAEALRPTIQVLSQPDTPRPKQVKALKRFRAEAADLVTACGGKPSG